MANDVRESLLGGEARDASVTARDGSWFSRRASADSDGLARDGVDSSTPRADDGDAYERMLSDSLAANELEFSLQSISDAARGFVRLVSTQMGEGAGIEAQPTTSSARLRGRFRAGDDAGEDADVTDVAIKMLDRGGHGLGYSSGEHTVAVDPDELETDVGVGLSRTEARKRLVKYGVNVIDMTERGDGFGGYENAFGSSARSFRAFLRREVKNPMIRVCCVSIALELAQTLNTSSRKDDPVFNVLILVGLIVANAYVSWVERADALVASYELAKLVSARATVVRGGRAHVVDASALVPGDVVVLTPGCAVPADCVNNGPHSLVVDNSAITGERETITVAAGEPLFMRGVVKRGSARALVVRTGQNTFAGRAVAVVRRREAGRREMSAFDTSLTHVMYGLSVIGCACSASVFLYLVVSGRDFFASLSFCVLLLITSTPLAIRTIVATTTALCARALSRKGAIVTRMNVIEDLASMNVLCVDKTGTLTRDAMCLSSDVPTIPLLQGVSENDVMTAAALSTKWFEPPTNAIDDMVLGAFDVTALDAYELLDFKPFDAATHRYSESLIRREDQSMFRVIKGPIESVLAECSNGDAVQTIVDEALGTLKSSAARGVISRALAVACSKTSDDPCVALGLVIYEDVRRRDANEMINAVSALGIDVKIITGDARDVAAQACEKIGVRVDDILAPHDVPYVPLRTSVLKPHVSEMLKHAKAFAGMLPEDKLALVKAYRANGDTVGVVCNDPSDAPALHIAHIGVSMNTGSDAAKSAADIILTVPSLSVLAHAVLSARVMFARVRDYVVFRATCTAHVLGFFTIGAVTVSPKAFDEHWPDMFTLPVIALCVILALNDVVVIGTAYDHASPSRLPEKWRLLPDAIVSAVSGLVACFTTLALLGISLSTTKADTYYAQDVGGRALAFGEVQTCVFLKIALTDAMTVFSARTQKSCVERRPGGLVISAFVTSCVLSCMLAANWPWMALESISWAHIMFVVAFSAGSFALQDAAKVITYRVLLRAGWMENVGVVSSGEFARVARAVDRAMPKMAASMMTMTTTKNARRMPERRDVTEMSDLAASDSDDDTGAYDVEAGDIESEMNSLLNDDDDDDDDDDDVTIEESDSESDRVDEFYSDYAASETTTIDRAPEIIAEMLHCEEDTPKFERLRRTPGYCMATLTDIQSITESHDWWNTFAALQREAARVSARRDDDDDDSGGAHDGDTRRNDDDDQSIDYDDASSVRTGDPNKVLPHNALTALDMGCGVGTFSAALARHLSHAALEALSSRLADPAMRRLYVSVDLLDVSGVALHAASLSFTPPFHIGTLHRGSLTSFVPPSDAVAASSDNESMFSQDLSHIGYDIVYSVHGFATVPRGKIHAALRNFRASMRPGGLGFIAAATEQSHDARFAMMYHDERRKIFAAVNTRMNEEPPTLTSAEVICDALSAQGVSYNVEVKSHVTLVSVVDGSAMLEAYLHGVAMDDTLSLDTMLQSSTLGSYLSSCLTPDGSAYAFPQRVAHVTI